MEDIRRLPDSELEIMQIIWKNEPPVSRSTIEEELNKEKKLAPSTIITFLSRLCDKGFLRVEHRGRTNLYTPLVSRRDYVARESRSFVERMCGGSMSSFAVALCDSGISKADLEELRTLLEEQTK